MGNEMIMKNINEIKEALESFTTPDGRNLYNVHCGSGYCIGYTKWGLRDDRHEIAGTRVAVPSKHGYGYTKTSHPISVSSLSRIKREFEEWIEAQEWHDRGVHFEIRDDEPFQRLELKIWMQ